MMHYLHYEPHNYFRFMQYGIRYLLEKNDFSIICCKPIGTHVTYVLGLFGEFAAKIVACATIPLRLSPKVRINIILPTIAPLQLFFGQINQLFSSIRKKDPFVWSVISKKG